MTTISSSCAADNRYLCCHLPQDVYDGLSNYKYNSPTIALQVKFQLVYQFLNRRCIIEGMYAKEGILCPIS